MKLSSFITLISAILITDFIIALWTRSVALTLSNLLFIEGGFIFAIGAFMASGIALMFPGRWFWSGGTLENYAEYLRQKRRKHFNIGLKMMIFGGALMLLSILIGELLI